VTDRHDRLDPADADVTQEVGGEGGSPGDVETQVGSGPGAGSEAGTTWRPAEPSHWTTARDEEGEGRRSP